MHIYLIINMLIYIELIEFEGSDENLISSKHIIYVFLRLIFCLSTEFRVDFFLLTGIILILMFTAPSES